MASSLVSLLFFALLVHQSSASIDYGLALKNSILYFEGQRSGKLPPNQRVKWRGDSALSDGKDVGENLEGGYYDAGDNVKFGFPMAYTMTVLSWGVVEFGSHMSAKNELSNALEAIRWGTDYLIRAHPQPEILYGEVGDGDSDHSCWQRPEDMTTPRNAYRIDAAHPGTDLAAETAAALAAASVAFKKSHPTYSSQLIQHAKQLFDFANKYKALYQQSIPVSSAFYQSSGYNDELLWAAAWLHRATDEKFYLDFLGNPPQGTGGPRPEFSWDDKLAGAQALVGKLVLEGKVRNNGIWADYKNSVEQFICSCIQKGNSNVKRTPGGLLFWRDSLPIQYVASAMLVTTAYSDYLANAKSTLQCPGGAVQPADLVSYARSQVDYILGANPKQISYMVGFGNRFPQQPHHRAASIVSKFKDPTPVGCKDGFEKWFNSQAPNPNVLVGAVVGGPDGNDGFADQRSNVQQSEPATTTMGPLVGVIARVA
ncbi:endoglucanase 13-like [Aristolochia californica]|uniref:endoglucanase 13-like n=1 Tax=Aristolochia californica TaxID=171875 RepID=UPI0035DABB71